MCSVLVPQSEAVRRLIPHIELEIMPKAGHLHNVDQTEIVNSRILKFLTK
jgi:pimeloyl-ACP methyl ester carboxylesterase